MVLAQTESVIGIVKNLKKLINMKSIITLICIIATVFLFIFINPSPSNGELSVEMIDSQVEEKPDIKLDPLKPATYIRDLSKIENTDDMDLTLSEHKKILAIEFAKVAVVEIEKYIPNPDLIKENYDYNFKGIREYFIYADYDVPFPVPGSGAIVHREECSLCSGLYFLITYDDGTEVHTYSACTNKKCSWYGEKLKKR